MRSVAVYPPHKIRTSFIQLSADNLAEEHLCCTLSGGKNEAGVAARKAWLRERFREGLLPD
jgi:hypothetical protein